MYWHSLSYDTPGPRFASSWLSTVPLSHTYKHTHTRNMLRFCLHSSPGYVLMGHSMGCITAATAALDPSLPPDKTTLILVAPALAPPSNSGNPVSLEAGADGEPAGMPATNTAASEGADEVAARGGGDSAVTSAGARLRRRARGVVGTIVGAPVSGLRGIRAAATWVFNWCMLPLLIPVEILALRCVGVVELRGR